MKKKYKKLYKKLLLLLLLLVMPISTGVSYAYWGNNLSPISSNLVNIDIGAELNINQEVPLNEGFSLVPQGAIMKTNDVNYVLTEYTALVDRQALLSVTVKSIYIGGQKDIYNLVVIDLFFDHENVQPKENIKRVLHQDLNQQFCSCVFAKVTLNMPENEAEYNFIKGQDISYTLQFKTKEL